MLRIEPGINQTIINTTTNNQATRSERSQQTETVKKSDGETGDTVTTTAARNRSEVGQLQVINERQNNAAVQIRQGGQQLQQADQLLGQMKHELYEIVKIYPPYPPGQSERVKFLRNFNSIRQEIEQLTIPPESTWRGPEPGQTIIQPQTDQVPVKPTGDVMPVPYTVPEQTTAGSGAAPQGRFSIPELPDMATDADIKSVMNQVDAARTSLGARRERLSEQAAVIGQNQGYEAKVAEFTQRSSEPWNFTVPGEKAAEQKSSVVRRELSSLPANGLLGKQAPALELLG